VTTLENAAEAVAPAPDNEPHQRESGIGEKNPRLERPPGQPNARQSLFIDADSQRNCFFASLRYIWCENQVRKSFFEV